MRKFWKSLSLSVFPPSTFLHPLPPSSQCASSRTWITLPLLLSELAPASLMVPLRGALSTYLSGGGRRNTKHGQSRVCFIPAQHINFGQPHFPQKSPQIAKIFLDWVWKFHSNPECAGISPPTPDFCSLGSPFSALWGEMNADNRWYS